MKMGKITNEKSRETGYDALYVGGLEIAVMAPNKKQGKSSKKNRPPLADTLLATYFRDTGRTAEFSWKGEDAAGLGEALQEVASPLLAQANRPGERRKIIALAIVAWNICSLPTEERESCLGRFIESFSEAAREDSEAGGAIIYSLSYLIGRRAKLYPNDSRYILRYALSMDKETIRIRVAGGYVKARR